MSFIVHQHKVDKNKNKNEQFLVMISKLFNNSQWFKLDKKQ